MKKLFLITAGLMVASFAPAAQILCASNVNTVSAGSLSNPTVINCGSIDAGAGNIITNVAIRLLGSFNDAIENTNHQLQFDASHSATAAVLQLQTAVGDLSGNGGPAVGSYVLLGTQTLAASTVSVITSSVGGLNLPENASVSVWLSYNTEAVGQVPEPSTIAMIGSALVGLGLVNRRKR